jgi:hypothetical protein
MMTPIAGEDIDDPELEESFNQVAAAAQNIDDLYRAGGRKLGEGVHKQWHKLRAAAGASSDDAKKELFALLADHAFVETLQSRCEKQFYKLKQMHKTAIDHLPGTRQDDYRALNVTGAKGTPLELDLPPTIVTSTEKGPYGRHLLSTLPPTIVTSTEKGPYGRHLLSTMTATSAAG